MAVEGNKTNTQSGAWPLLLIVPAAIAAVLLMPQLGEQGEGLLAELLGSHVAYSERFAAFASETWRWGLFMFIVAILVGIVFWAVSASAWRTRLQRFDARVAMNYRGLVGRHTLMAFVATAVLATGLIFLTVELREMPVANWATLILTCASVAAAQHFATIWAIPTTRRLFRGR